jgi:hypothetical protein
LALPVAPPSASLGESAGVSSCPTGPHRSLLCVVLFTVACCSQPLPAPLPHAAEASSAPHASGRVGVPEADGEMTRRASAGATEAMAKSPCARFAETYCARAFECSAFELARRFGDAATCAKRTARWCARELAAPGTGFSLETLSACGAAVVARPCGRWRRLEDLPVPACHPRGRRRVQDPCFDDAWCASGFCSHAQISSRPDERLASPCGVCAPVVGVGELCAGAALPFAGCPLGSMCSRGVCVGPFMDEGEPCAVGAWYATCYGSFPMDGALSHLDCDYRSDHPLCRRRLRPVSCAEADECWEEDYCNSQNLRCEPKQLVRTGASCDSTRTDCAGGSCRGTCTAPKPAGAPCTLDDECEWPAQCVGGSCLVFDPTSCEPATTE